MFLYHPIFISRRRVSNLNVGRLLEKVEGV